MLLLKKDDFSQTLVFFLKERRNINEYIQKLKYYFKTQGKISFFRQVHYVSCIADIRSKGKACTSYIRTSIILPFDTNGLRPLRPHGAWRELHSWFSGILGVQEGHEGHEFWVRFRTSSTSWRSRKKVMKAAHVHTVRRVLGPLGVYKAASLRACLAST